MMASTPPMVALTVCIRSRRPRCSPGDRDSWNNQMAAARVTIKMERYNADATPLAGDRFGVSSLKWFWVKVPALTPVISESDRPSLEFRPR